MYQALYRKYRPKTFSDVVGQSHVTETLRRQVETGRLSHAYLFTGTRGTGKTTCAKILAKAVNCRHPVHGEPCNRCDACVGLDSGAILDVLELDAASNNSVDYVRALREEAVYTPGSVKKRVYIIDEVHMLSTSAFNALLKILEEPPEHLMFILATTELHKVLPTIRSRCQQFAFKRILPDEIAHRLTWVAQQENIPLTPEGADLLARLADGGMRDALSLLDQCQGGGGPVDQRAVIDALGMAGNLETARLLGELADGDTAAALGDLDRLYAAGKDVKTMLGELAALCRDLLIRKTAPQGGAGLLTGGYDDATLRGLSERLLSPRLIQMLTVLQETIALLPRSGNQRTDAELCFIRLGDESLDGGALGLSARVARLETMLSYPVSRPAVSVPDATAPATPAVNTAAPATPSVNTAVQATPTRAAPAAPTQTAPVATTPDQAAPAAAISALATPVQAAPTAPAPVPVQADPAPEEDWEDADAPPPWEEEPPPVEPTWEEPPVREETPPPAEPERPAAVVDDQAFWPALLPGLKPLLSPAAWAFVSNAAMTTGVLRGEELVLEAKASVTKAMIDKPEVRDAIARAASARLGRTVRVSVTAPAPAAGRMDDLLKMGKFWDE